MRSSIPAAAYADHVIDALQDACLCEDTVGSLLFAVENDLLSRQVVFETLLMMGSPEAFSMGLDPQQDNDNNQIHAQLCNNWAVELLRDQDFKERMNAPGYVDFWYQFGWSDRCRPSGLDDFKCI